MTFEKPTTKAKMYEVLQEIFHYYRVQKEEYTDAELAPLNLERMEFTEISAQDMLLRAKTLLEGKKKREVEEYKAKINREIAGLNSQIGFLSSECQKALEQIETLYQESEKKIQEKAQKNGLADSSIIIDKIAQLEASKNNKIAEINAEYAQKISEQTAQITELDTKREQAESLFSIIYEKEEAAKLLELKEEQEKTAREVFKYNNSLVEKEIKHANSLTRANIELKLKFLQIRSGEMTKDDLVRVGYYDDVLECVYAFYDSMPALDAYNDIIREERLMVFLDDYYESVLYLYKMRANS